MKPQRQDTKVIETPFGKATMRVEDENTCHFYFGVCNEDFVEDYQCVVDGYSFNGRVDVFSDTCDYNVDYCNPSLPVDVVTKVVQWCCDNQRDLTTFELVRGAKIETLLKEIEEIKKDLNDRLPKLLEEKNCELAMVLYFSRKKELEEKVS